MPRKPRRSKSTTIMSSTMSAEEREWKMHRDRMANVKPMVDCYAPREAQQPPAAKLGRMKIEQDYNAKIQRENYVIFKSLQKIHSTHEGPGRIEQDRDVRDSLKRTRILEMRSVAKKREQERIERENMEIFHRLNKREPNYKVDDWLTEYEKNREYKANMDRRKPKYTR